jgi:integrase
MGMIYKRGKVWWIKYYKSGKPYRESTKTPKESDAKRLLKKREGEISEGKQPGIYYDKILYDELAEDFVTDYRINAKRSLARAKRSVKLHLDPFFHGMKAPNVTTTRVKRYIEKRQQEGAANATINRELAALKRMFNLGARSTPPKVVRVPYIPMLAENNVRQGFFEHDDFLALRDAIPHELKGMLTFAYKTGWRVSEVTGLTWPQVDLKGGIVRLEVGTTKNKEARIFYLDEELMEVFRAQFANRQLGCPYVFHRDGRKIKEFRKSWSRACREAKIGKMLFHDFRRTAVRNMVRAGIPERVAMMVSGHKTRTVFDRYNIVSPDDLKQASGKMETYLRAQKTATGTVSGTVRDLRTKEEVSHVS